VLGVALLVTGTLGYVAIEGQGGDELIVLGRTEQLQPLRAHVGD
jgi:hypothetical protein